MARNDYPVTGALYNPVRLSMERTDILLTGLDLSVHMTGGGVGFSRRQDDRAEVQINFNRDFFGNGRFEENIPIYWGINAHEMMHILITDFDYERKKLEKISSRLERKERHSIANIVEDPAIEYFSPEYLPKFMVDCLRKSIVTIAKQSMRIEEGGSAYEQLLIALVQFGDIGILFGEFTYPEAEETFGMIAPVMNRAITERSFEKRFDLAMEIFEILKPLWKKYMTDTKNPEQRTGKLLSMIGKNELSFGSGQLPEGGITASDTDRESVACQNRETILSRLEKRNVQEQNEKTDSSRKDSGQTGIPGRSLSGSAKEDLAVPSKCVEKSSSGWTAGSAEPALSMHQAKPHQMEEASYDLSQDTIRKLSALTEQGKEQMIKEEKESALKLEAEGIDVHVKSPYIQGEIPYNNIPVKSYDSAAYGKLLSECSGYVNGLTSQLRHIFLEDRTKRSYHTSGKIFLNRAAGNRITARMFTKKSLPAQKADMSVMVLIDQSGSMSGSRIENAKKSTLILSETLSRFHIPVKTVGFTTRGTPTFYHYGEWENSKENRIRLMGMKPGGGTFLGFSIRYAGELLRRQKTKHKVFMVITDGCPEAPQYRSFDEAFSDVRDALIKIQKDADIIGIGLFGDSMELKNLYEKMFGKSFLSMDDISDLPSLISGRMRDIVRSW